MTTNKVIWCDRGWMPYYYGFCPNERAWRREMKRLGVPKPPPYPAINGACTNLETKDGKHCSIITIGHEKRPAVQVVGLLAHEGMHVWRAIRESIGEREPSSEFEAYAIQAITQDLITAYQVSGRGKLCR